MKKKFHNCSYYSKKSSFFVYVIFIEINTIHRKILFYNQKYWTREIMQYVEIKNRFELN
jgi:hypothetical protein